VNESFQHRFYTACLYVKRQPAVSDMMNMQDNHPRNPSFQRSCWRSCHVFTLSEIKTVQVEENTTEHTHLIYLKKMNVQSLIACSRNSTSQTQF